MPEGQGTGLSMTLVAPQGHPAQSGWVALGGNLGHGQPNPKPQALFLK